MSKSIITPNQALEQIMNQYKDIFESDLTTMERQILNIATAALRRAVHCNSDGEIVGFGKV